MGTLNQPNCIAERDYVGPGMTDGSAHVCVVDIEKIYPNKMGNCDLFNCATNKAFESLEDLAIQPISNGFQVTANGQIGDGMGCANPQPAQAIVTLGTADASGRRPLTFSVLQGGREAFNSDGMMNGLSTPGQARVFWEDPENPETFEMAA